MSAQVLNIVLAHLDPETTRRLVALWSFAPAESILIAHGGKREDFDRIAHAHKIFVANPRLATKDHPRERQSVAVVFERAAKWLTAHPEFTHVLVAEYDHVPLVPDLNQRQLAALENDCADVLAFHLARIDGTNHPHYLYHAADPSFHAYFAELSRRSDREVVLAALGTGSFWRREAFTAVAAHPEPFPIYQEIHWPTLAHHLGFRVRDWGEQNSFVQPTEQQRPSLRSARAAGAWSLHPVKSLGDLAIS